MPRITKSTRGKNDRETVIVKTKAPNMKSPQKAYQWWRASNKEELGRQLIETAVFLKQNQMNRYRQAAIFARLYGNMPLMNFIGSSMNRMTSTLNLPIDRPTMNVVQSCTDTLVARITQSKPKPTFLTDNGHYKERNLAKELNSFIAGELYQTDAYNLGGLNLRDACILGTGCTKIFETSDHRVALERRLEPELLVDPNDSFYGKPQTLYEVKLVDRGVATQLFPDADKILATAEQAFPDESADYGRTTSDQLIIVEGWHLPSGKDAKDGLHAIACTSGLIDDNGWEKSKYPFVFLPYCPRLTGFWGQGLAEQLMGTQVQINEMLITSSRSTRLTGVPRVWVEDGSKVVKAHINNEVGMIGTYRGTAPIFMEGTTGLGPDFYQRLQSLIEYAYQQAGISQLAAGSKKPSGLNSGEALRNYDDIQDVRYADLEKRYHGWYEEVSKQMIELAKEIAIREGKYETVYPNRDGTRVVNLPAAKLEEQTYVIQCFDESALPREPAARLEKATEMAQSGMISLQEARRILGFPDLEQIDRLANAQEERIYQVLDEIVFEGKFTPPDPPMDLEFAEKTAVQYYNLYIPMKLEEKKAQMLRDFIVQVQTLKQQAMAAMPTQAQPQPQAVPGPRPVSPLLPNAPQGAAA